MSKKDATARSEFHCITDLEQVKALSHPMRLRILEILTSSDPMTTKQISVQMKEQASRLYHHVDLLEKVGLIRLTHTNPVRGATEKYYAAIARSFSIAAELFSEDRKAETEQAMKPILESIFGTTRSELMRIVDAHRYTEIMDQEGIISSGEMYMSTAQIEAFQAELKSLIERYKNCLSNRSEIDGEPARRFRFLLAHFPLDRFED